MPQWQLFWPWQSQQLQFVTTVDMGGGRVINSVDIVDGHAQRLSEESTNDLTSAIHVVAPQLAPLTDLAQEIADRSTKAHPDDKFRSDLQRALETTHRQQTARRSLGIQAAAQEDPLWWESPWAMVVATLVTLLVLRWLYRRISHSSRNGARA